MDRLTQGRDDSECTTSSRDWAMLIITVFSINVSWWLFDIPLLWTHGPRRYLNSVTWQCFRTYAPGCAAVYALMSAHTSEEEPYVYYIGPFFDELPQDGVGATANPGLQPSVNELRRQQPRRILTLFQISKYLIIDSLAIISTGLTVHTAINLPADAPVSGIALSTWAYPSLPVALLGLWLLLCGTWLKWSRKMTLWLGLLLILAVGAAIITPLITLSEAGKRSKLWIPAIFGYVIMALPVYLIAKGPLFVIGIGFGFIFRVGGIGIGSLSPMAYFPFCPLRHKAFGATYLAVGGLGAVLAIGGAAKYLLRGLPKNPRNRGLFGQHQDTANPGGTKIEGSNHGNGPHAGVV